MLLHDSAIMVYIYIIVRDHSENIIGVEAFDFAIRWREVTQILPPQGSHPKRHNYVTYHFYQPMH